MLFPRSHGWTRTQKWFISAAIVLGLIAFGALVYRYERYHRGPTDAVFFGTWEVTWQYPDLVMPSDGPLYYEFKSDHTYQSFGITPLAPHDRIILETGTWYAGGNFVYLRLPYEQASYTALLPFHIDSMSPSEVQVHIGRVHGAFKRVSLHSPSASNQSMKPTARPRNESSVFVTTPCRGLSLSR